MSAPPLPDEVLLETIAIRQRHRTQDEAAAAAGISRGALQDRLRTAARRGLLGTKPVLPGFQISKTTAVTDQSGAVVREFVQQRPEHGEAFEVPEGHVVKGISALVDSDGLITNQWIKTKTGDLTIEETVERIKRALDGYKPKVRRITAPKATKDDLLTLIPCNDWHINMLTWEKDTGQNWDLKIAEKIIGQGIEDAIARSPNSGTAIVLGGGDLMHADNDKNRTEASGNVLDADGRHQKGLEVAQRLKVKTIDAALRRHKNIIVRILRGNHDEYSSVAIAHFLLAWYRNEPRVTVDVDASLFFWHRFGKVFIGATHGHTVKLDKMASIMAHRRAEDWGLSKFRYIHGFHIHHFSKVATEGDGVIAESHQAPVPQDAWHFGSGYLSGRSMQVITYHKDFGEIGRARVAILDGTK